MGHRGVDEGLKLKAPPTIVGRALCFTDLGPPTPVALPVVAADTADGDGQAGLAAELEREVHRVVREVCAGAGVGVTFRQTQSIRPGRPTPTHRFAEAV